MNHLRNSQFNSSSPPINQIPYSQFQPQNPNAEYNVGNGNRECPKSRTTTIPIDEMVAIAYDNLYNKIAPQTSEQLSGEGKRILGLPFLSSDGIVFDWSMEPRERQTQKFNSFKDKVNDGPGPAFDFPPSHKQDPPYGLSVLSAGADDILSRLNVNCPLAYQYLNPDGGECFEDPIVLTDTNHDQLQEDAAPVVPSVSSQSSLPHGPAPENPTALCSLLDNTVASSKYFFPSRHRKWEDVLSATTSASTSTYVNSDPLLEENVPQNVFFRFNYPADLNRATRDCVFVFEQVPLTVGHRDISRQLRENGFSSSTVREISLFRNGETNIVAVEFTDKDIAQAAYKVMGGTSTPEFSTFRSGLLHIGRLRHSLSTQQGRSNIFERPESEPIIPSRTATAQAFPDGSDRNQDQNILHEVAQGLSDEAERDHSSDCDDAVHGNADSEYDLVVQKHVNSEVIERSRLGGLDFSSDTDASYSSDSDAHLVTGLDINVPIAESDHLPYSSEAHRTSLVKRKICGLPSIRKGPRIWPADYHDQLDSHDRDDRGTFNEPSSQTVLRQNSVTACSSRNACSTTHRFIQSHKTSIGIPAKETCSITVALPRTPHGRARRILVPESDGLPITAISMRADAQFIHPQKRHRISTYSLPHMGVLRHVEDACIIGDTVIIGYSDGPSQLSIIPMSQDKPPRLIDIPHLAHQHQISSFTKTGIASLSPVDQDHHRLRFLSGGNDKFVNLWSITGQQFKAKSKQITVLESAVNAIAYHHRTQTIFSSAGKRIWTVDMEHPLVRPASARLSNEVNHIHVHRQAPNVIILEVRHLDYQVQMFDIRKSGFDKKPCTQFGYRTANAVYESRYVRGSSHHSYFVRGYADGFIKLWDFRNIKHSGAAVTGQHKRTEPVVHTEFVGPDILAYGEHIVTFLMHP